MGVERFRDAYLRMAGQAKYRPAAPGDGFGGIYLDEEQLRDPGVLELEARKYAEHFRKEEDSHDFWIGCSDYEAELAFVYTIEAARCLCAGHDFKKLAVKLLRMAVAEVRKQ